MVKFFLVLAAVIFFFYSSVAAESPDETKTKIFTKCQQELKVPESVVKAFLESDSTKEFKDHKCYVKCLFEQFKYLKPDGSPDAELIHKTLMSNEWKTPENEKKYGPIVKECISKVKKTPDVCEYTYNLVDCYSDKKKKV